MAEAYANLGEDALAQENVDRAVDLGADRSTMDKAIEQIKRHR